ncbi:MAG: anti-sigma factor [Pedobacter sp.]|nr:anti-sigma factor [Chitinophagaceae bacterium]
MNIDNYISSGAIESYVLGIADAQEAVEVQQLSSQYPEIKQAVADFEASLEMAAFANATLPAASVKERLMFALQDEFAAPIVATEPATIDTLPVAETAIVRNMKPLRYMAAASVILLVASAALNIFFYSKYTIANEQIVALLNERNTLTADNQTMQVKYLDNLRLFSDTNVIKVSMKGVAGKESNLATVYWNNKTKDVYLLANQLPKAPSDKQYQLWALVDGKPVDAGMVSVDCNGVCKVKNILNAQAFAITLEKKGGSPTPDLTQLQVIGNVKV